MKRTMSMAVLRPKGSPDPGHEPKRREIGLGGGGAPSALCPDGGTSGDLAAVEMAHFLRACGLCKRHLGHDQDIFIYRGELAFCSLECREKQINLDEQKGKFLPTSMKAEAPPAKAGSEPPSGGVETAAAA